MGRSSLKKITLSSARSLSGTTTTSKSNKDNRNHSKYESGKDGNGNGITSQRQIIIVLLGAMILIFALFWPFLSLLRSSSPSASSSQSLSPQQQQLVLMLRSAAMAGDSGTISDLLRQHPSLDINNGDRDGMTAIHYAIVGRHEWLLMKAKHYEQFTKPSSSSSPSSSINPDRDYDGVIRLLANTGRIKWRHLCPLYHAVQYRDVSALQIIINASHDDARWCANAVDGFHETVLHIASRNRAAGLARLFLTSDGTASSSSCPLNENELLSLSSIWPSSLSDGSITWQSLTNAMDARDVELLLTIGAYSNKTLSNGMNGNTPLHLSALTGRINSLQMLMSAGSHVDELNDRGQTPLHLAYISCHCHIVQLLIDQYNANITIKDRWGRTPIESCFPKRMLCCCNDNNKNKDGTSTLPNPMDEHHRPVIHQLVAALADTNKVCRVNISADTTIWHHAPSTDALYNAAMNATHLFIDTIDVNSSGMNYADIERHYYALHRPVLLRHAVQQWSIVNNSKKWSRTNILDTIGDVSFSIGKIPYASDYGTQHGRSTLNQYMSSYMSNNFNYDNVTRRNHPPYLFEGSLPRNLSSPTSLLSMPFIPLLGATRQNHLIHQLMIGPRCSGAPPHFHRSAINALAVGTKLWMIWPPTLAFFNRQHIFTWMTNAFNHLASSNITSITMPMLCIQSAGDAIYIPSDWGHAVINLDDTVAIAVEFVEPSQPSIHGNI
jgi:ankyrin repeat protein